MPRLLILQGAYSQIFYRNLTLKFFARFLPLSAFPLAAYRIPCPPQLRGLPLFESINVTLSSTMHTSTIALVVAFLLVNVSAFFQPRFGARTSISSHVVARRALPLAMGKPDLFSGTFAAEHVDET